MPDPLETRLRDLGRALPVEPPDDLVERVLARLAGEPVPRRRSRVSAWLGSRARWISALVVGLVGVGIVVSPVGAEVREWLGFHGVVVESGAPDPTGEPTVLAADDELTLEQAARRAGFTPLVPAALGDPDRVAVSADRTVISMNWGSGDSVVRLDQFGAELDPRFWKVSSDFEIVTVDGVDSLWLPTPHDVQVLGDDGEARSYPPRLAAATLIWPWEGTTLRLEGDLDFDRAAEIVASTR